MDLSSKLGDTVHGAVSRVVEVKRSELAPLGWALACYALLLTGYFIARPVRESFGLAGGVSRLPTMMMATVTVVLCINPLYSWLVARQPRSRFVPQVFHGVVLAFLAFSAALHWLDGEAVIWAGRAFYVFLSVVNLFLVSVFFSLLADLFDKRSAARLYGCIVAGGSLGGMLGGRIAVELIEELGPAKLLLLSCVFFEAALWAARGVMRSFGSSTGARVQRPPTREDVALGGSKWAGFQAVVRSPYLLGIYAYVLCYGVSSTLAYMLQAKVVKAATGDDLIAATKIFAELDFYTNAVALFLQFVVAGRLIKWIGAGATLMILPLYSVLGFGLLTSSWVPATSMLGLFSVFQILRRALGYGLQKPARELLFTVLPVEDKYKAKNLIDLVGARSGDFLGALTSGRLEALGLGLVGVSATAIPVSLLWTGVSLTLGAGFRRRARRVDAAKDCADTGQEPKVTT